MLEIKKILFPVDFSEAVDELVPFALTLAHKFAAELCVLTVTPDMSSFATFYAPHSNIQNFQDEVYQEAHKKLEALAGRLKEAPKVETRIAKGNPADQIIQPSNRRGSILSLWGPTAVRAWKKPFSAASATRSSEARSARYYPSPPRVETEVRLLSLLQCPSPLPGRGITICCPPRPSVFPPTGWNSHLLPGKQWRGIRPLFYKSPPPLPWPRY
jgi:hypothetical protein